MSCAFSQEEKFQKAEDLTEEAKRAAREAHLKAEEALRKAQAAQAENEKAAIDRGRKQEETERLQHIKKLVCIVTVAPVMRSQAEWNTI